MKYVLFFAAAIFFVAECRRHRADEEVTADPSCIKKDVDGYLDKVLEKARAELDDPMRLPPRSTYVELSDGLLWGMSELRRGGKAEVTCDGDRTTIEAQLTVDQLKARYTWTRERKKKSPQEGYVVVKSNDFLVDIELVIDHKQNEVTHPVLKKFVIQRFKDVKVEITGAGYLSWALGEFTTLMSGIFQRSIAHTVQDPIKEALDRRLAEVTLE